MATRKHTKPAPRKARPEPIDQDLLLAAMDRAGKAEDQKNRHVISLYREEGSPLAGKLHAASSEVILRHLGYGRADASPGLTPDQVEAALRLAVRNGFVERNRVEGVSYYRLTSKARRHLGQLKRLGRLPELPENPAWVVWQRLQERANQDLPRLREKLRGLLKKLERASNANDWHEFLLPDATSSYQTYGRDVEGVVQAIVNRLSALEAEEPPQH